MRKDECLSSEARLRLSSRLAFHTAATLAPPKGLPAASNNRLTCTADHLPPRAAGMPRSSNPAAMARSDSQRVVKGALGSVHWNVDHCPISTWH
jgi:hypothetical protein